jgi:hypothetical protein
LRAAELATWEPLVELRTASQARGNRLSLRASLVELQREQQKEFRLFAGISAICLVAVASGLWSSFELVQKWQNFVDFVARWLG